MRPPKGRECCEYASCFAHACSMGDIRLSGSIPICNLRIDIKRCIRRLDTLDQSWRALFHRYCNPFERSLSIHPIWSQGLCISAINMLPADQLFPEPFCRDKYRTDSILVLVVILLLYGSIDSQGFENRSFACIRISTYCRLWSGKKS